VAEGSRPEDGRRQVAEVREQARAEFRRLGPGAELDRVAGELFALAGVLTRELRLRRALADPSLPGELKRRLLGGLLGDRAHERTFGLLGAVVDGPRLLPVALADLVEELGALALFVQADAADSLDEVEDELYRFSRLVAREHALHGALADPALPVDRKLALVDELLAGRANPLTVRLVRHVVQSPRGRTVERATEQLARQAAAYRGRVIAEVTVAAPLEPAQVDRLREALGRQHGGPVRLQVVVDPSMMGGVIVRIGDEIIDGSMRRQLERARGGLG
jgi:F-type H+-transporting ATPase subunit delta